MLVVKEASIWDRPFSALPPDEGGKILIPAGAPVDELPGQLFFVSPKYFPEGSIERSDAENYGCAVSKENVRTQGDIKNLSYANGWLTDPPEYVAHRSAERFSHHVTSRNIVRCCNQYTCHACDITWKIDSSDWE